MELVLSELKLSQEYKPSAREAILALQARCPPTCPRAHLGRMRPEQSLGGRRMQKDGVKTKTTGLGLLQSTPGVTMGTERAGSVFHWDPSHHQTSVSSSVPTGNGTSALGRVTDQFVSLWVLTCKNINLYFCSFRARGWIKLGRWESLKSVTEFLSSTWPTTYTNKLLLPTS